MTRVLPVPAPARMTTGPDVARTAVALGVVQVLEERVASVMRRQRSRSRSPGDIRGRRVPRAAGGPAAGRPQASQKPPLAPPPPPLLPPP